MVDVLNFPLFSGWRPPSAAVGVTPVFAKAVPPLNPTIEAAVNAEPLWHEPHPPFPKNTFIPATWFAERAEAFPDRNWSNGLLFGIRVDSYIRTASPQKREKFASIWVLPAGVSWV